MDPNEALRVIREELNAFYAVTDQEFDVARFADHVNALDEWLTNGGFLPDVWQASR